jgi:hypothetical protein
MIERICGNLWKYVEIRGIGGGSESRRQKCEGGLGYAERALKSPKLSGYRRDLSAAGVERAFSLELAQVDSRLLELGRVFGPEEIEST